MQSLWIQLRCQEWCHIVPQTYSAIVCWSIGVPSVFSAVNCNCTICAYYAYDKENELA